MKKLLLSLLALPLLAFGATIHLVGDSTMANYPAKRAPLTGWGMALQKYCADGAKVNNRAISGTSSKSFRTHNKKFWDRMIKNVKAGDFVVIQFGINDASKDPARHAAAGSDFQTNLKAFISEVRAKGATPVLCTQIVTCRVNKKGVVYNATKSKEYVAATLKVAKETGCEVVDLNTPSLKHFNKIGAAEAEKLYMMGAAGKKDKNGNISIDRTHLNATGADYYAALFAEIAKAQNLSIGKLLK